MRHFVLSEGCFTVSVRYLTTSRDGVFWFYRRIPIKAKDRLGIASSFVRVSLGTRNRSEAIGKLAEVNAKYEAQWSSVSPGPEKLKTATLRALTGQTVAFEMGTGSIGRSEVVAVANEAASPLLSEALAVYLSQHPKGFDKRFAGNTRLAIEKVIETAGDLRLHEYTRRHANNIRDQMLANGLKTTSVRRRFDTISSVFKAAVDEHGLSLGNPFSGVRIAALGHDAEKREEFTTDEIRALAVACRQHGDDRRCIIAMLIDTGARLGEIVGLRVSDVVVSHAIPHILIRPYAGRSLKTGNSERKVPLVGEALWAASKAALGKASDGLLFPDYGPTKANSASATLNKWVRERLGISKTMHGLRHSMKTRLRSAGVSEDIQNRIGGWADGDSVSRGYGSYPLDVLRDQLERVVLKET